MILLGFGFGLLAATIIVGRRVYWAQYQQELDDRIPAWVNQGNRAVIGTYDEVLRAIVESVHFQMWEDQLADEGER